MSGVHIERVGNNVVICRERDRRPECYWFKYGDAVHLAMVLGAMNISDCNVVREIAEKAGVNAEDFVAKYCDSKPHPELYGMRSEVVRNE